MDKIRKGITMRTNQLWNISTQQIQIFLKAVELKNFTQVANYFNFTPSMISKTITAMEEELGFPLFIRKPNALSPTPTAVFLSGEWRQTIAAFNNSIEKAQIFQQKQISRITLGFVDSSSQVDALISDLIREYSSQHPNINILIEKHDMHRAAELLNNGLLDIIITSEMEVPYLKEHNLPWEKIVKTSAALFIPAANHLFHKEIITLDDIKEEEFLSLNPTMHPTYQTWLHNVCSRNGFIPNIAATYRTVRSLMFTLKLSDRLFIGDTITSDWCDEELRMYALPESSFTLVAWRSHNASDELIDFKNFIRSFYPESF